MKSIIRPNYVAQLLGISRTTLWRLCKDKDQGFPERIQLTKGTVGFFLADIESWLETRPKADLKGDAR
jgi:predicted DNA-binding transcriptional regulator AlpA